MKKYLLSAAAIVFLGGTAVAQNNDAFIGQIGSGNVAAVTQDGFDNFAHRLNPALANPLQWAETGSIYQNGNDNFVTVTQTGDGNSTGWDIQVSLVDSALIGSGLPGVSGNYFYQGRRSGQIGNENSLTVTQTGNGNLFNYLQIGNGNAGTYLAQGDNNAAFFQVYGHNNKQYGTQIGNNNQGAILQGEWGNYSSNNDAAFHTVGNNNYAGVRQTN